MWIRRLWIRPRTSSLLSARRWLMITWHNCISISEGPYFLCCSCLSIALLPTPWATAPDATTWPLSLSSSNQASSPWRTSSQTAQPSHPTAGQKNSWSTMEAKWGRRSLPARGRSWTVMPVRDRAKARLVIQANSWLWSAKHTTVANWWSLELLVKSVNSFWQSQGTD